MAETKEPTQGDLLNRTALRPIEEGAGRDEQERHSWRARAQRSEHGPVSDDGACYE